MASTIVIEIGPNLGGGLIVLAVAFVIAAILRS